MVPIELQHNLAKVLVKVLIFCSVLELVPVSRDETDKRVPDKQELGVFLQLFL